MNPIKFNFLKIYFFIKVLGIALIITSFFFSCSDSEAQTSTQLATDRFVDERDQQSYEILTIGEQKWMGSDLKYASPQSYCYDKLPSNCEEQGRLYPFNEALTACPNGWKLPSDKDWGILEAHLGMNQKEVSSIRIWRGAAQGRFIKEQLYVTLSGSGSSKGKAFEGKDIYVKYWTKTDGPSGKQFAIYRMFMKGNAKVYSDQIAKMNLCCIRCLKE